MSAISLRAAVGFLSLFLAAAALPAQTTNLTAPPPGMSKVRIVRLSEVRGTVQVKQGGGQHFEPAPMNLPIVESDRIRTGIGVAEVEFEDDSTLRLATDTQVDFPKLERAASGATVTDVRVVRGMVYVSLVKKRAGNFLLEFGSKKNLEKVELPPSSHIRLQVSGAGAQLAVLGGSVPVNGGNGLIDVGSQRTVSFTPAKMVSPTVTKKVVAESLDAWDRQAAKYHARVARLSAFGKAPYSYGLRDLSYYGAFSDIAGCGRMWLPYFAGASWDPYGNGAWAWYPGAGYSWVSPYPWGWLPYHYGAWSYCPGTGWGWIPGGVWNGLNNAPTTNTNCRSVGCPRSVPKPRPGPRPFPHPPKRSPGIGGSTLIAVKRTPLVRSGLAKTGNFIFVRGSAGLGIPRKGLGGLRGFSRNSLRHGVAATPVYVYPLLDSRARPGRTVSGNFAPLAVHRGYAPRVRMSNEGSAFGGGNSGTPAGMSNGGASVSTSSVPSAPVPSSVGSMRH